MKMVSFCKMLCRVLIFVNSSSTCRADARVCLLKVKKKIIGNKTKKKYNKKSTAKAEHEEREDNNSIT